MDAFSSEDVRQYYRGAFIRHPQTGAIRKVADVRVGSGEVYLAVPNDVHLRGPLETVPQRSIQWEHVKIPRLGYRCFEGKFPYYLTKKTGRITSKGVSSSTISVTCGTDAHTNLRECGDPKDCIKYTQGATLEHVATNHCLGVEVFNPSFIPMKDALAGIEAGDLLSAAISHDFLIGLGTSAEKAIVLYFKGWTPVAYSSDGKTWALESNEFKDVIERGGIKL